MHLSPWSSCVLEKLGLPMYFANEGEGAVFLDDVSVHGFDDDIIRGFLRGTLVLSAGAADALNRRGFGDYTGVTVHEWNGKVISTELVDGIGVGAQYGKKELRVCREGVEELSQVIHRDGKTGEAENLFPGVTRLKNALGGEVIVFSGTPDMPFKYFTAFSMLNETRKKQLISLLGEHLPLYYPEDVDVYVRAGRLANGEILCAVFDTSFDTMEDIPLVIKEPVHRIEKLNPDGTRSACAFTEENGVIRVAEEAAPYTPVVLFIS